MTLHEAEDLCDWLENHQIGFTVTTIPIEVVPNTNPPRFRWRQTLSTPNGIMTLDHEGSLPPTVENVVVELISLARQQAQEIVGLRRNLEEVAGRTAQSAGPVQRRKG